MYKSKYILILGLVLSLLACDNLDISSNQADTFIKLFGSSNSDIGNDVKEFNGGYLILATMTSEDENSEIVLIQTNKYGNQIPNGLDTLSSLRGGNNKASKLLLTDDGGFIVLGTVEDTANNNTDIYLNKFSSNVVSEWERFIGSASNEQGTALKKASSGYIIAGSTTSEDLGNGNNEGTKDIFLVKVDNEGNVEWTENHGGNADDYSSDVIVINNGYVVLGTTNSFDEPGQNNNNIMLVETNLNGGSPDFVTYGGSNNDYGQSLVELNDGGYLILGTVENTEGKSNIYALKVEDNIHNILWNKEFGTTLNDMGFDLLKSGVGFIIVGSKELSGGFAGYFFQIDNDGNEIVDNTNTFGGYGQIIYAIEPTSDGGYIMTGSSGAEGNEMVCLIKVNSNGEL